jgi:hypothetical protein
MIETHRAEIAQFAEIVQNNEVAFVSASYRDLLAGWCASLDSGIRAHAQAVITRFNP